MKHISVIGCGTMGNGIAQTFALFEFKVKLYDISLNNLDNAKKNHPKKLRKNGKERSYQPFRIKKNI